jgi:hypothetical protein
MKLTFREFVTITLDVVATNLGIWWEHRGRIPPERQLTAGE